MGHNEKCVYLREIRGRYRKANRLNKAKILDEFCQVCGYNRKYAIRLLGKTPQQPRKKPGSKPKYLPELILEPLKRIWFTADQPCSKKLKVMVPEWLPCYEETYGLLEPKAKDQVLSVSISTIDRLLKPVRAVSKIKGLSGTKPGSLLKTHIPLRTDHWDATKPGFLEADTVAHCGTSLAGNFVWSLTMTDICSGWTENRATWNKGSQGVFDQVKHIENSVPFAILGFDCDNGTEFLNHHLHNYFTEREEGKKVQFTRSRPYHKNDNAHVEQKNWTHVRQLFGYERFPDERMVALMNDLYSNEWSLFQNHFLPSMKLIEKQKIKARYSRKHDKPKTPYQRLMDSPHLTDIKKEELRAVHQALNPFTLKAMIEKKLKAVFSYITVTSNVRQRI